MMDEQIEITRGEFYRLLASAYDHGAKSEGLPTSTGLTGMISEAVEVERSGIAKMVRRRICFDNLRVGVCDHSVCFGMQELLDALVEENNA
jgi:hypothetical protein